MEQKPSVGRIVHFKQGDEAFAALIVKVWDDTCVNLIYWNHAGSQSFGSSVLMGSDEAQWSWPPRV